MKTTTLITAAIAALTLFGVAPSAEARHKHSKSYVYVSGYRSCGTPVYTERYLRGYDRCGYPVWGYRTVPRYCPPPRAYSIRPAWVTARFAPSPTTRARRSRPSTRTASFARSPTCACDSSLAFTYVPMPPFHSRSTGSFRIALTTSLGVAVSAARPSSAFACGVSFSDLSERDHIL